MIPLNRKIGTFWCTYDESTFCKQTENPSFYNLEPLDKHSDQNIAGYEYLYI